MTDEIIQRLLKIQNDRRIKDATYVSLKRCYQWCVSRGYSEEDALDETIRFMFIHTW